jgi:hypothetical protein
MEDALYFSLEIDLPPGLVSELKQEAKAKRVSWITLCRQAIEAHASGDWPRCVQILDRPMIPQTCVFGL